jgi:hypothetical protein
MRLILIFLLVPIIANGQIVFDGYVEIGYLNEAYSLSKNSIEKTQQVIKSNSEFVQYQTEEVNNSICYPGSNNLYTEIKIFLNYKRIHFEQNVYNILRYESGRTLTPLEILYESRIFLRFNKIDIGYDHMCSHPIIVNYNNFKVQRETGHDKIFIRLNFKKK